MHFGRQQHVWNSITANWTNMKILEFKMTDGRRVKKSFLAITDFSKSLPGEAVFRRISARGEIPAFHKTYVLLS